jgi:hypothetical protein
MNHIAAWLSRHPFPADLPALLPNYTLLHVRGDWRDYRDAYFDSLYAANCHPDAVLFILPMRWRNGFVRYVTEMAPATLLLQPLLLGNGAQVYKQLWLDKPSNRVVWAQWEGEGVR